MFHLQECNVILIHLPYKLDAARTLDVFPALSWISQSLDETILIVLFSAAGHHHVECVALTS
jgi:hypothetical protein